MVIPKAKFPLTLFFLFAELVPEDLVTGLEKREIKEYESDDVC